MNKLATIIAGAFFLVEIIIFLSLTLEISYDTIQSVAPVVIIVSTNIVFLFLLLYGLFSEK